MSKLLYINASPRVERSNSKAVADAFVQAYRRKNPDDLIDTLNVFEESLPAFDGLILPRTDCSRLLKRHKNSRNVLETARTAQTDRTPY